MSAELDPPSVTEEICSVAVPELVSVMVCGAAVVPWVTAPRETEFVESVTAGLVCGGAAPVPVSWTDCGELGASSVMTMLARRCPAPNGENVTLILHVAFTATAPLHALVRVKSPGFVPLSSTDTIFRVALPALVRVTLCAALVAPWAVVGKVKLPGASVTAG